MLFMRVLFIIPGKNKANGVFSGNLLTDLFRET